MTNAKEQTTKMLVSDKLKNALPTRKHIKRFSALTGLQERSVERLCSSSIDGRGLSLSRALATTSPDGLWTEFWNGVLNRFGLMVVPMHTGCVKHVRPVFTKAAYTVSEVFEDGRLDHNEKPPLAEALRPLLIAGNTLLLEAENNPYGPYVIE